MAKAAGAPPGHVRFKPRTSVVRLMVLAANLADWTDADIAAYLLGRQLGFFDGQNFQTDTKGVFWTDNPLGNCLHKMLLALADAGILETRDEPALQFRWNPAAP